jgi:hypothetical protein
MKLKRETLHLAVNFFDRYNSCTDPFAKENLQMIGVVSLFIASKSEEITAPQAEAFIWQSAQHFRREQVFAMEAKILSTLRYYLLPKTPWSWVKLFIAKTVHLVSAFFLVSPFLLLLLCRFIGSSVVITVNHPSIKSCVHFWTRL